MRLLRIYGAAVLVPGLAVAVLGFNVAAVWAEDGSAGLPLRLTAAGVAAALSAAVAGTLILRRERRDGPGYGVGPRQATTVVVRGGPDLPYRVKVALLALRAEIREADVDAGRYTADTHSSRGSSGEHVTVELTGDPDHPEARISSRPRSRLVLDDRGKGRRNVRSVIDALQE